MELIKSGINRYLLPKQGKMKVNCYIYATEKLAAMIKKDNSLRQLTNAASLIGVVEPVCGMPDLHQGFGLPIGGVMATGGPNALISAGAVGMDINCGVRLLRTELHKFDLNEECVKKFVEEVQKKVPTGIGKGGSKSKVHRHIFQKVLLKGSRVLVEEGFGFPEDLTAVEENGLLEGADIDAVSKLSLSRGESQLGTLGGGNHFIELQEVENIEADDLAHHFGLFPGQITVMIHTGSRGFGHQICTDFCRVFLQAAPKYGIELPERGLAGVPVDSPEGKEYFAAMAAAVNFAFANRQLINWDIRGVIKKIWGIKGELVKVVYDLAHNIAKWEHCRGDTVLVHRKGAIRALPPKHPLISSIYKKTGNPVLVPGTMGTSSYIMVGTKAAEETFFSVNHGAGRVLSRRAAWKSISGEEFQKSVQGIYYGKRSYRELVDEAPGAYKDIDEVVKTLADRNMVRIVARLRPLAVVKGKD